MLTPQDQTDLRNIEKKVLKDCEEGKIPLIYKRENSVTSDFTDNEVSIQGNILDSDFTLTFFDKREMHQTGKQRLEWFMEMTKQMRIDKYNEMMEDD